MLHGAMVLASCEGKPRQKGIPALLSIHGRCMRMCLEALLRLQEAVLDKWQVPQVQ